MWLSIPDWQIAGGFAMLASITFPLGALCGVLSCNRHRKMNNELLSTFLAIGAGSLIFAVAVEVYAEGLDAIEYIHPDNPLCTVAYVIQILSAVAGALLYIWLERSLQNQSIMARLATEPNAHPSASNNDVEEASVAVNVTASADRSGERGDNTHSHERDAREANADTETETRACTVASSCERRTTHENQERERLLREVSEELHETEERERENQREAEMEVDERSETPEERPPKLPINTEMDMERPNEDPPAVVAALAPSSIATSENETAVWSFLGQVLLLIQSCALIPTSKYLRLRRYRDSGHTYVSPDVATEDDLGERERLQRRQQFHANNQSGTDQVEGNVRTAGNVDLAFVLWTSQLVDAVPEAMMIGFRTAGDTLSWAFIIALCISNFPESFCGGYLMRKEGMSACRTLLSWFSVSLLTSVVSICTVTLTPSHKSSVLGIFDAAVQGVAAGAMLALATASMLPAAYEAGGVSSGLYCVVGFLLSLSMRLVFGLLNGPASLGEEGGTVIHAAHTATSTGTVMAEDGA